MRRALILVVATVLLAGCGGGGGSRLSKSELDGKANAICAKYSKKINDLGQPPDLKSIPAYVDKVLPLLKKGTDELNALKPPEDLESTYNEMISVQRESFGLAEDLKKAAQDGDQAKVGSLATKGNDQNSRFNALARQIGADTCAKD